MILVVTEVTEMHAGSFCVAGWDPAAEVMAGLRVPKPAFRRVIGFTFVSGLRAPSKISRRNAT
jgi:hypothetical protein